jgi:hypothetical protein
MECTCSRWVGKHFLHMKVSLLKTLLLMDRFGATCTSLYESKVCKIVTMASILTAPIGNDIGLLLDQLNFKYVQSMILGHLCPGRCSQQMSRKALLAHTFFSLWKRNSFWPYVHFLKLADPEIKKFCLGPSMILKPVNPNSRSIFEIARYLGR